MQILDLEGETGRGAKRQQVLCLTSLSLASLATSFLVDSLIADVAVRAGHHCTQPLHTYLGISHTARASCYVYNDESDIDVFVEKLKETIEFFSMSAAS